jgi:hypothetical protein
MRAGFKMSGCQLSQLTGFIYTFGDVVITSIIANSLVNKSWEAFLLAQKKRFRFRIISEPFNNYPAFSQQSQAKNHSKKFENMDNEYVILYVVSKNETKIS